MSNCKALTVHNRFCKNKTMARYCNKHRHYAKPTEQTWFHNLPSEILQEISNHFTYHHIAKLQCISKSITHLFESQIQQQNLLYILIKRNIDFLLEMIKDYPAPMSIGIMFHNPPGFPYGLIDVRVVHSAILQHEPIYHMIRVDNRMTRETFLFEEAENMIQDMLTIPKALKPLVTDWNSKPKITIVHNTALQTKHIHDLENLKFPPSFGEKEYSIYQLIHPILITP